MNARVTGRWLIVSAAAATIGFFALPLAVRGFAGAIELLLEGCVSVAVALSAGASTWGIVRSVTTSLVLTLTTPGASGALAGLVLVAVGALWGLQRLLGSEWE